MEGSSLKIADIIIASLTGEATDEQRAILDEWLAQSDKNQRLYLRLSEEVVESDVDKLFSVENSWDKLVAKLEFADEAVASRNRFREFPRKYLKYAAILILPLAFAVLAGYYISRPSNDSIELLAEFSKDYRNNEILLINSEGKAIAVDPAFTGDREAGVLKVNANTLSYVSANSNKSNSINRIIVPRGKTFTVQLSDGSMVRLNSESELIYPVKFSKKSRTVMLKGEGYFDVARNPEAPFRVKTLSYTVKVLGTHFNVKSYPDDEFTTTTLVSGRVCIEGLMKSTGGVNLKSGEQLSENRESGNYNKRAASDAIDFSSWTSGKFYFENACFSEVIKSMERAYDVQFVYNQGSLDGELFSGSFIRYSSIDKCFNILEYGHDLKFTIDSKTVYITKKR